MVRSHRRTLRGLGGRWWGEHKSAPAEERAPLAPPPPSTRPRRAGALTSRLLDAMQESSTDGIYNVSSRTRAKAVAKVSRGVSEGTHPRAMEITPSVLAKHAARITAACPDPMNLMARQRLVATTDYSKSIAKYAVPADYVLQDGQDRPGT